MSTLGEEAVATLREAERLVRLLPIASKDREAAEDIAAELREICRQLADIAPSTARGVRETVYGAQALLRVIAGRHAAV
jgi:hypothetical protein